MDLTSPLKAVCPGVEGDVLVALLRSHAPLTGAQVASLAGRSETQVREVLRRLASHGLVDTERHGQSYSYLFNREHVLAPGLELLYQAPLTTEDRIRDAIQTWTTRPVTLILFGSAARRNGSAASDVDLLLVRPDEVDPDDQPWAEQRHALARSVERWTGNSAQVIELSASELASAVRQGDPLIDQLRVDGVLLSGTAPVL